MEIFMRNIAYTTDENKVTLLLAPILHSPLFEQYATSPGMPLNFKVSLFRNRRNNLMGHSGCGALTLPSESVGFAFLRYVFSYPIAVDGRLVSFVKSKNNPRPDRLGEIRLLPYRDPREIQAHEAHLADLSGKVKLQDVQFGWMCRDGCYSIEWQWNQWHLSEDDQTSYSLFFRDESREIIVERRSSKEVFTISIRYSRIQSIETDGSGEPCVLFTLESPPSLEKETIPEKPFYQQLFESPDRKREKRTHLDNKHMSVAPFLWNSLRLVCTSRGNLAEFRRMAEEASLRTHESQHQPVRRRLFDTEILRRKDEWLRGPEMPWLVAFQCEALHRNLLLDTAELLSLRTDISVLVAAHGVDRTVQVLREFGLLLRTLWTREEDETVQSCFELAKADILHGPSLLETSTDDGIFRCLHVTFTPTTMCLRGPFPDTSNRILRLYPNHHNCFLRVTFADEDRLKFRFGREVDGPDFIKNRVGGILRDGFIICGRPFQFLAYSQSALKEYTMWFVTPFKNKGRNVDAEIIRGRIGSEWPEGVKKCPARFAARLSQAFTATESFIFVENDQIERIDDIERNGYCFSDGNGPVTQEMANAIHDALQRGSGRGNRTRRTASVFQVRIQGAKGTLSIDSRLSGMKLSLRPSMVKFESQDSHEIEIARSFHKPGKLFLNRPLVMILAGLGVDAGEFLKLQRSAVKETETSSKTMKRAARLLETHGLGTAFALPSTLKNLHKSGLEWEQSNDSKRSIIQDPFTARSMKFAVNHVLREMKYRARIPVPQSWKLVGVVDVHSILEPYQIYACVIQGEGATPEYLHGRVLVSKSPTIHPGDVQMAIAIGAPPEDSPLRALNNCVVFSQLGDRPLPNELSGSDLDGDEYDLILLPAMHPPRIMIPGEYPPAPRKILDYDSTIIDIADFVVDFINNDMLGIIATNFLLIADRDGIFDKKCLTLAELHSWAVDFAKSGVPVPHRMIPLPDIQIKPDWHAPELSSNFNSGAEYYESQSVLGKLFRDINLPQLSADSDKSRAQQRRRRKEKKASLEDTLERLSLNAVSTDDPISMKLRRRLRPLVDLIPSEGTTDSIIKLFDTFAAELEHICFSYTLSRKATARLSEEEVFMGTIIAKSSQPRMRKDNISRMREETTILVRRMRKEIEGGEETTVADWINRAWTAWQVSVTKENFFGAKSFGWIALRSLFDGIKFLEDEDH